MEEFATWRLNTRGEVCFFREEQNGQARQVTVLNRLTRIIERMRMAPERGFNLTPDEQQLSNAYSITAYQMSQAYTKSATPEAAKTFQQMLARDEDDPALYDQMIALLSAATLAVTK